MRDHTSLIAWREAEVVSLAVIDLGREYWRPYVAAAFAQLQRAALSVQLNLAEGYAFTDSPTFRRHLNIAYGSAVETGELLSILAKSGAVPPPRIAPVLQSCRRSQRLLLGLIRRRPSGGVTGRPPA